MGGLRGQEWLIVLLIVLVLFGASRLPALARSVGKSARILKDEVSGTSESRAADDDAGDSTTA